MQIPAGKKIYFLSDFHLGVPNAAASLEREKLIVRFLDEIFDQTAALFIVGDMFDFWYEYKKVVPKGYVRLLGKLAAFTDAGIPVHFFVGNHDMWMKDYFQQELGIPVYFEPKDFEFNGLKLHIGHGDGLGPGDHKYKMLKKVFRNPVCQWLFGIIPSSIGIGTADYFSQKSRAATGHTVEVFLGEEKEWLITYSKEVLQ
ncbi:MAG TPA: UDP-2,3-diacylglucosamine diphosphatase, partial [Flavisolibacter sp.]|nr:UDP-2,3-diacylglucosamine diphosphatase [Flavisolibacter sp.]